MTVDLKGKVIIFSAPSGAGKTTIIRRLLEAIPGLRFSVSATSRAPRGAEMHGQDYYFLSPDEFRKKVANGEFLEWEEVYTDKLYGTLKQEVENIRLSGNHVVFDVDVAGGLNIKRHFGNEAIAVFIMPPSIEELQKRLEARATDTPDVIAQRIAKAKYELSFAPNFDKVIINDNIEEAVQTTTAIIEHFLAKQ
ncbi:MAG: guanylate kinase [Bacteroidales bacterium]|jgi:guanylate kinase|nr:guanylate kinase [Bacteroidales bacterium]